MSAIETRPRAGDLLKRVNDGSLYREAVRKTKSLSALLNDMLPDEDGLDGFEQVARASGFVMTSDPEAGYYASNFGALMDSQEARGLIPEFVNRQVRKVKFGGTKRHPKTRAVTTADLEALGSMFRPYDEAPALRRQQVAASIPVGELVAINTPVQGDAYQAAYLTQPAAGTLRYVRIGEAAEIPRVTITLGSRSVRLHKYGRAIEVSYEVLRRATIDKVALWVQLAAVQTEVDRLTTIMDILINGDGNSGTAATEYNATAIDAGAAAGTLRLQTWLAYKLKWANPYMLTHVFLQEASGLALLMLALPSANVPLFSVQAQAGFGGLTPMNNNLADGVRYGLTTEAPTLKIVGIDSRFALERVIEIGGDVSEVERFVMRQTQALTFTEVEGFMTVDQMATRVLDINE